MNLRWIEDFLALAETQSFSRASEIRNITQSALSRRIRSLEEWVGAELVNRGAYPVVLTKVGKQFCEEGRVALKTLHDVRVDIRRDTRLPGRAFEVRAGHTLSMTFLPRWLKQLQRRKVHFNARVVAENVLDAVNALSEGACDLMFCYHYPHAPILLDPDKFDYLALGTEALIPVSAAGGSGQAMYILPGKEKRPIPYLAYTSTTFLGRIVDIVLRKSAAPHFLEPCHEADMAILLMNMAKEGYGVAWVPESAAEEALQQGRLVRAGGDEWSAQLEIRVYRAQRSANAELNELWRWLEAECSGARRRSE